jgi:hypothetical protein
MNERRFIFFMEISPPVRLTADHSILFQVRLAFLLCLAVLSAIAQDGQLAALHATLAPLRAHAGEHREIRDATPELTAIKHQLRDWVESRLAGFPQNGGEDKLTRELGDQLRDADLFCEPQCRMSILGFLDNVRINREREFLIVRTSVGIWCGYDDSAYAYAWKGKWQRIWESEQDNYDAKRYFPQGIQGVQISAADKGGNRLLLSLGAQPGCSSAFQPVYYRVWRIGPGAKLLLDKSEFANVGDYPPAKGSVEPADVRIELTMGGTGYGSSHQALRHYTIHRDKVEQADPIAPTPRDFVEEWLSTPWAESAARSDSPALKTWHEKLHRDDGMGDFPGPTLACSSSPELRQVSAHLHDAPEMYFLVRWREAGHSSMAGVSERPFPNCGN